MDFSLSPELDRLRARVREFVSSEIIPLESDRNNYDAHENIAEHSLTRLRERARAAGLWAPQMPRSRGGMGLPVTAMAALYEEMGHSIFGPVCFNCAAPDDGNMMLVEKVGTDAQKRWWLQPVVDGRARSAFAMTEPAPGSGSDPAGMMLTRAERSGTRWKIHGRKWFITGAGAAKHFIVLARTSDDPRRGLTAFLFDAEQPGWRIVRRIPIMGPEEHGGHCELEFEGLEIEDENVLMGVGDGLKVTQIRLGVARLTHCMRWLGMARRSVEIALDYVRERQSFGSTLASHEGVQWLLGEAVMAIDIGRLLTMRAAWKLDQGDFARPEISMAKIHVSETLHKAVDTALQLQGARGYSKDTPVEWMYRYARQARLVDGASEIHKMVLAESALKRGASFWQWGVDRPAADPTSAVRAGFELDAARLEHYLREHVPQFAGPLTVRQFKGGQSNPTYLLSTPGRSYVLRRKPAGQLLPSAHAVDREYRIMKALRQHTDVPVPEVLASCSDDSVIGTAFYVMAHVQGRMFWDPSFPELPANERKHYFDAMNAALASLHKVDYLRAGLGDFGKPGDYFARQINRWSQQYRADTQAGRVVELDRVIDWLLENIPSGEEVSLVHGDYRCDNLIFHPSEPRVLAVLDWELSTVGHPLADLGYHLMMYRLPTLAVPGLLDRDLSALGIPSESDYVAAYCARTRRDGIDRLDFYVAFNLFRFAAILHGIRGRLLRGNAVSERAREYARHVEAVASYAWQTARRAS
jgi:acyl-CoA dehydrogenase